MHDWPATVLKRYETLRRLPSRDLLDDLTTLNAVQTQIRRQDPEPEPQPGARAAPCKKGILQQFLEVKPVGGQIVEHTAAYWLNFSRWDLVPEIKRVFHCHDAIVPDIYFWLLHAHEFTFVPNEHFIVGFDSQKFKRICQLKADTSSPYVLEGNVLYFRIG